MDRKESCGKIYIILKNTLNGFARPSLARLVEHYASRSQLSGCEPLYTGRESFSFTTLKNDISDIERVSLVGNLCTSTDVIAEDISIQHLERGDIVIINNAGAYAAALSPMQFSSQEIPKEFFIKNNSTILN